ncbi:MAG: DUF4465 domain-containing protein [Porphyromonadaceae bacterium]|nr:DUF4465 domain-containing protein [Porphyromonadaceae bacterium]
MKRLSYILILCLLPLLSWAQTVVQMPSVNGKHDKVTVSTPVTFYDAGGATGDIPKNNTTAVTFTPQPGHKIQIVFENIALGAGIIKIFDGDRALNSYWDEYDQEDIYTIPSGHKVAFTGNRTNETIVSESPNGKLTVCFTNANAIAAGWKATVSSIEGTPLASDEVRIGVSTSPFTVANTPLNFYDDGGINGNISSDFEGSITFVPADAGKKVQISFNKLDLFNTSTIGRNDILKIYNGTTANEANLLATLLKDATPVLIKSTAADGALTVTLKSTAGITKSGFEAVVTQFTPVQMAFNTIELSQYTSGTVCAADKGQTILSVNVKTTDDLNPLTTNKFVFSSNNTFANIKKATLYYTGKSNNFAASKKVGEVDVNADVFEILTSQTLIEGNNYFWLTYDLKENAVNGEAIDAGCTAVTVADLQRNVAKPHPEGNRIIKNEYISTIGKFTKKIYGEWSFTHTTQNQYSTRYKAEQGDQIVTFVPDATGKVVQIEFADFDVFISSNSYGVKAKFEIYSGVGTSGTKLWAANTSNKSKGPEQIIRSQSPDGALTIVFNANTTMSVYTANGWHAKVSNYMHKPMETVSVDVFQSNTDILSPSSVNQDIIGIEINTEGDQSPINLEEMVLNLKGSYDKISKVSLFYTGATKTFTTATLVGELVAPSSDDITIIPSTAITLAEGKNYFWVAYDIKSDVENNQVIDASLVSVKTGGVKKTPTNGNPAGERIIKLIYIFQNGNHTINVTSSLLFYDNGGAAGNYTPAAKGTVTFVPKAGEKIKFVFKSINTRYNDYFIVLNGGTDGEELAKLSGTTMTGGKLPIPILSSAADGSLTVKFEPKSSNNAGWEIEVLSIVPQQLSVGSIKSTVISTDKLLRGSQNENMLKIEVAVEGDLGNVDITSFDFSTENTTDIANISSANLYATDTVSVFSANNKYSTAIIASPIKFKGNTSITKPGIYKFWLAYDVASTAKTGNVLEAKLNSIQYNNNLLTPATSDKASRIIKTGFKGSYTIGSSASANYKTFAAAIEAMKGGIEGKVEFEVEDGTYNELVAIPHIEGASEVNTITFKSKSNDNTKVVIMPKSANDKAGVVTVDGADYLTLNGISIKANNAKQHTACVLVRNISNHVTVKNCYIEAPRSSDYSVGDIALVRVQGANVANQNSDYFTLENSTLSGGYSGVYVYGTGFVALPKQKGARIAGNTFINQGNMSIYITKEHDGIVENNRIAASGTTANPFKGIDAVMMGNTIIRGNRIYVDNTTDKNINAIYLRRRDDNETLAGRNRIYNNEIIIDNAKGSNLYGIYFANDGLTNTDIVYNSVNVTTSTTVQNSAPIFIASKANTLNQDVVVKNNIFQNNAGGYVYRVNTASSFSGVTFGNNALYTSGTNFAYGGAAISTFEDWKTKSGETNSVVEKAQFFDAISLDLTAEGNLRNATPLNYVTDDINATVRDVSKPTIGAYEFAAATSMPQFAVDYPTIVDITNNSAVVKVKVTEKGTLFYMVKPAEEQSPTATEVVDNANIKIAKNLETQINLTSLVKQTKYKVYFVLQSFGGQQSGVVEGAVFTTAITPTEVSTFETVAVTSGNFTDGTADFSGFVVETITDGQGANNKKAAKMSGNKATVTINNSDKGLILKGFYFKSDVSVTMIAYKGTENIGTALLQATAGKWVFINLKSFNEITGISLEGTGNIMIDNFSGEPQPITFALENKTANEGESVTFTSDIYGGVLPYKYAWTNSRRDTLSKEATLTLNAEKTGYIYLTVTDGWGNQVTSRELLTVLGTGKVATFDDLYLAPESYWMGDTVAGYKNTFYSGSYSFSNVFVPEYKSWGAFGYSNHTSTIFNMSNFIVDQFNSVVGKGVNNSDNYAVVYPSGYMGKTVLSITQKAQGDSVSGFYITNTAWVKHVSENGTGFDSTGQNDANKPFTTGDWLKLTAKGDNGKTVEFYLADYRDAANTANHYILDSWQWVDLRSLGVVKTIEFSMDGTRKNNFGTTIPTYFCMDDFGGVRNIAVADTVKLNPKGDINISLNTIFEATNNGAADIVYTITDSLNRMLATTNINANTLRVVAKQQEGKGSIIVQQMVKGKTLFVKIPFVFDNTVTSLPVVQQTEYITIYPNPATEVFSINTSGKVEIFTNSGHKVYSNSDYIANTNINVSAYTNGFYFVIINGKSFKLIVR